MTYDEFKKGFYQYKNVIYIYALCEPYDDHYIRYIGKSSDIKDRLICHLIPSELKKSTHKNNWLKLVILNNQKPNIIIIDVCDENNWEDIEKFWISHYREVFPDLTNEARGGQGGGHPLPEEQKEKMRKFNTGKKASAETIEKLRLSHLDHFPSEETREKMSKSHKKRFSEMIPEERRKQQAKGSKKNIGKPAKTRGMKMNKDSFSKYVGVYKTRNSKIHPFRSCITVNNKYINLGCYTTEEDAARAYNEAALKYFGPDAKLNIIE